MKTRSAVYRLALKDALGFPALMLFAGMTGFGSLARESGLSLGMSIGSTVGIWSLPGQIAMVEMYVAGTAPLFVILAVSLANARFLPMAVSLIPLMREGLRSYGWMYLLVQFMSINPWASSLRRFPQIAEELRVHYYFVFILICMPSGVAGTLVGYFSVSALNRPAALGLIFLNPLFFSVLLATTKFRPAIIALLLGAPLGPMLHSISPDWGLLVTGLIGGSGAFFVSKRFSGADQ